MPRNSLQFQQLDKKFKAYKQAQKVVMPSTGWIQAIREVLGISLEQLGQKLSITRQSVGALEEREREGAASINSLKEFANAMDMDFVYGFVPKDGSLDALVERKAKELATQIVLRTSNSMKLENQENTETRIKKAIKERAAAIRNEMPKTLWD